MPTNHLLKCERQFFDSIVSGSKPFTVRRNDRHFQTGDFIEFERGTRKIDTYGCLEDFVPDIDCEVISYRITYILQDFPGIKEGFCVLGLERVNEVLCADPNAKPKEGLGAQGIGVNALPTGTVDPLAMRDLIRKTISDIEAHTGIAGVLGQRPFGDNAPTATAIAFDGDEIAQKLWADLRDIRPVLHLNWSALSREERHQVIAAATSLFLSGFVTSVASKN